VALSLLKTIEKLLFKLSLFTIEDY